jgi:hypothetical protein
MLQICKNQSYQICQHFKSQSIYFTSFLQKIWLKMFAKKLIYQKILITSYKHVKCVINICNYKHLQTNIYNFWLGTWTEEFVARPVEGRERDVAQQGGAVAFPETEDALGPECDRHRLPHLEENNHITYLELNQCLKW